uniref:G_PROTEIN_RECEP_F1_2 domain-containing protein n=1 Tax=Haemonchus contortus TaxID=6289 RepID=A0A7I5EBI1_HAECO
LVSNMFYRAFILIQITECIIGLIALPMVHYGYLVKAALHINLKALLSLYFHICIVYAVIILTCRMYEAVLWLSYRNPCDMFPSRGAYHFYAVMEMYCLMHMISLQLVVGFERVVATIFVHTYESWKRTSPLFIFATFIFPGAVTLWIYHDVEFVEPNLSCFTDQSAVKLKVDFISVLVILFGLVGLTVQSILANINKKRTARLIDKPLTVRYQLSENIAGTTLTSYLQLSQVLATIVFSAMMLACSEVHLGLIENERDINYIIKEGVIPLAVAILPFLTRHLLKKRQIRRNNLIQQSVLQPTSVYSVMLEQQWK